MNIHGDYSYWKQGALVAAGVRHVWAGAGPQRTGAGAYCAASGTACYNNLVGQHRVISSDRNSRPGSAVCN